MGTELCSRAESGFCQFSRSRWGQSPGPLWVGSGLRLELSCCVSVLHTRFLGSVRDVGAAFPGPLWLFPWGVGTPPSLASPSPTHLCGSPGPGGCGLALGPSAALPCGLDLVQARAEEDRARAECGRCVPRAGPAVAPEFWIHRETVGHSPVSWAAWSVPGQRAWGFCRKCSEWA